MIHSYSSFDALVFLSFGGPEGVEDVIPFLENVTRGRGIPQERLKEVGAHYYHFGGVSPLNSLNKEMIANLEECISLPIYFANRNWHPQVEEVFPQVVRDGHSRILVFATSAWGGYSGDIQYREDIQRGLDACQEAGLPIPQVYKIPPFFDEESFHRSYASVIQETVEKIPDTELESSRFVFTAHSIPVSANDRYAHQDREGWRYSEQVAYAADQVAQKVGVKDYDLVWQSRSGAPHIPWLEPDIVDHAEELAAQGIRTLIVCPIGFISDHIEVLWDLDTELQDAVTERGMNLYRVPTPGPRAEFRDLILSLMKKADELCTTEFAHDK